MPFETRYNTEMIEPISDVAPGTLDFYDDIIDVRSPAEFADDSLPRAINLAVLSNEERGEVGRIYAQESKFNARRIGAGLVARNIARHLETILSDRPPRWRPLVFCWRGGMRSNAMAMVLSQVGWRVGVVKGGYKTWRRAVVGALHENEAPLNLLLLDGQTGTAKSEILSRLAARGVQVLDLEEMAAHRGSVFGARSGAQPSQRRFESSLFSALARFDASRPVVVEAESAQIGRCAIPRRLWRSMRIAPYLIVRADPSARADYLLRAYAELVSRPESIDLAIDRLRPFHSKEEVESWRKFAAEGNYRALAARLMSAHYDPRYERSRASRPGAPVSELTLKALDRRDIDDAARRIAEILDSRSDARAETGS